MSGRGLLFPASGLCRALLDATVSLPTIVCYGHFDRRLEDVEPPEYGHVERYGRADLIGLDRLQAADH